jgi:hypothetical protein
MGRVNSQNFVITSIYKIKKGTILTIVPFFINIDKLYLIKMLPDKLITSYCVKNVSAGEAPSL